MIFRAIMRHDFLYIDFYDERSFLFAQNFAERFFDGNIKINMCV